jgi:hypothetical protein
MVPNKATQGVLVTAPKKEIEIMKIKILLFCSLTMIACGGFGPTSPMPDPTPDPTPLPMPDRTPIQDTRPVSLRVVNRSSQTIYYLYVSPSSQSGWGSDQLGSSIIRSGSSYELTGIPCGVAYDLKAEAAGHSTIATRFNTTFPCGVNSVWTVY